jgi:hypothetical protein
MMLSSGSDSLVAGSEESRRKATTGMTTTTRSTAGPIEDRGDADE